MDIDNYLSFREIESLGELLPLGAHHVLVLLEGLLELEELARAERRPDPLGLPEGLQEVSQLLGTCDRMGTLLGFLRCIDRIIIYIIISFRSY